MAAQSDSSRLTGGKCPICGKPAIVSARPFCSKRCGEIDLGRWMSGSYVIASGGVDDDEDGDEAAAHAALAALPDDTDPSSGNAH